MFAFGLDSMIDERYSPLAAANSAAGIRILFIELVPEHASKACFLLSVITRSMVAQVGASSEAPDSNLTGNANSAWATTNHSFASVGGSDNFFKLEAAIWLLPLSKPRP